MVLITDEVGPDPANYIYIPLLVQLLFPFSGYNSFIPSVPMAYEDVIPAVYFNPGSSADVIDILLSLPIPHQTMEQVFISWSKDVGYKFTKYDMDILRQK